MISLIFNDALDILRAKWLRLVIVTIIMGIVSALIYFGAAAIANTMTARDTTGLVTTTSGDGTGSFDPSAGTVSGVGDAAATTATTPDAGVSTTPAAATASILRSPSIATLLLSTMGWIIAFSVFWGAGINAAANDETLVEDLKTGFTALPALSSQTGLFALPGFTVLLFASIPGNVGLFIVGLVLSMLISLVLAGPTLFAATDATLGERSWHPRTTVAAMQSQPRSIFLVGLVVGAASLIPIVGTLVVLCAAVAWWRNIDVDEDGATVMNFTADDEVGELAGVMDAVAAAPQPVAHEQAAPPQPAAAQPAQPVPTQVVDGVLAPGTMHNEWIGVGSPGEVMFQLAWSEGPVPGLHLADQAGTWLQVPPMDASGVLQVTLAAGWYNACVTPNGATPQSFRISVFQQAAHGVA